MAPENEHKHSRYDQHAKHNQGHDEQIKREFVLSDGKELFEVERRVGEHKQEQENRYPQEEDTDYRHLEKGV